MSGKFAKIKRHEIKCLIEQEYGLVVKDMHEGDRGIFAYTDKGVKILKRVKEEESKILFSVSAYNHLKSRGFHNVSCINAALSGRYIVDYKGERYMLQDYAKGKPFVADTNEKAALGAVCLAKLHEAACGFVPMAGTRARVDWGKWMEKFKSYTINIRMYKRIAEEKAEKTKFDKLFLSCADEYYERMNKAYLILKNYGYLEKVRQSMKYNQLIHRQYRKHSLILTDDQKLFVTNMDECSYDIAEVDIAAYFESFSGKNKVDLVKAALTAYLQTTCLDRNSVKIMQAFLIEPKRFYKVVERYYGKKKNYTESELVLKLERSIKRESRKNDIIDFLESYAVYEMN